jgi:hypothetical protein
LNYSFDPRARARRRAKRALVLIVLVVAVGTGWIFRGSMSARAKEIYWAHQCAIFAPPHDTPLWESQSAISRSGSRDYGDWGRQISADDAEFPFHPDCWTKLAGLSGAKAHFDDFSTTVFLHEMRTPSGSRRIVHVESMDDNAICFPDQFLATVIDPPRLFSPPRVRFASSRNPSWFGTLVAAKLSLGRIDPADPSHVTIEYDVTDVGMVDRSASREVHGIIDGYLSDDDVMTFKLRMPTTPPRTTPNRVASTPE